MALSEEKKREMKIFAQFYEFNEKLIVNMKYGREKFESVAEGFEYVKRCLAGYCVVCGERGEFLKEYLEGIGSTDALTQLDYLNDRKVTLAKLRQESEEAFKKYGALYFKLCLMAGILVAVLLA